jgi:glycosyltransferase involved in cell wall biosynthesis
MPATERKPVVNYVVFVGRLAPEKGVRTLLNTWRQLKDIPLKLVGNGPLRLELEEFVSKHNLPVQFLGQLRKEEVLRQVAGASLQVVPSEWYEGFPMVILEAFSQGTPVVASNIGGLPEIIRNGQTGTTFAPGDEADLLRCIKRLMQREDERKQLGLNVLREFSDKYTAQTNLERLVSIYGTCLGGSVVHGGENGENNGYSQLQS